jgi:hypothetical protein
MPHVDDRGPAPAPLLEQLADPLLSLRVIAVTPDRQIERLLNIDNQQRRPRAPKRR